MHYTMIYKLTSTVSSSDSVASLEVVTVAAAVASAVTMEVLVLFL